MDFDARAKGLRGRRNFRILSYAPYEAGKTSKAEGHLERGPTIPHRRLPSHPLAFCLGRSLSVRLDAASEDGIKKAQRRSTI
jgi:hypothetical protein